MILFPDQPTRQFSGDLRPSSGRFRLSFAPRKGSEFRKIKNKETI